MRNTRRRGNVLSFFLGLLFGVIVVIGGCFGAGFYAYKKAKVGKIMGDFLNEDLSNLSIEQFIKEVSDTFKDKDNLTLNKLGELIPAIANLLPEEGIEFGTLGKLDVQKLKEIPVSQLSASFSDAIVITATLSSLDTEFGATLPDMPFIRGGEEGKEVWSYVEATELDGEIYKIKSSYTQKDLYALIEGEYVLATETEGESIVVKSEYEGRELWYKTNGLMNINVIDAVSALSSSLDVETLTLRDLESKFGINLKQGEESYHPIIEKMLDKKVSTLGSDMDAVISDLYLTDVITIEEDDVYMKAICYKRDVDGDMLGVYDDGTNKIEVKVDANGIPLDDTYGTTALPFAGVKIVEVEQQIDNVRLKDFLGDKYDENDKIMSAIGDKPLSQIDDMDGIISDLYLTDVITIEEDDVYMKAICYKRDADGSLLGVYDDGTNKIEVKVDANGIPLDATYGTTALPLAGVKISEIEQQINNVPLKDFLGDQYDENDKIMSAIGDKPLGQINDMDGIISDLYLSDVITVEEDDVYMKAICYKRDADGDLLGVYDDGTNKIEVKVDANGIPLDATYGMAALPLVSVKISELEAQINNVRLKDFLGEQYDASNKIMSALGDTPLGMMGEKIESLTLVDVMSMENRTLRALGYKKADNGSGEYWYQATKTDGTTGYLDPTLYEVRADGKFYEIATNTMVVGYTPVPALLSDVALQVDHLIVRECMEFDAHTPHVMYELANVTISEIGHAIFDMDMRKVLGDEHLTGYIRVSKQATRVGEKTGVSVGEWYILPSFELYYSADGLSYTLATIEQITAKQHLYTFDTTYEHYVKASKIATVEGEVDGVNAGEWYILPDHEYYYSEDGKTFTKATEEQIVQKKNLYIHDLLTFWHFVFHQEDEHGNEIIVTINNIGESVDHITGILSEAKIGLLYDRGIFLLDQAPLEVVRLATLHDVIELAARELVA